MLLPKNMQYSSYHAKTENFQDQIASGVHGHSLNPKEACVEGSVDKNLYVFNWGH